VRSRFRPSRSADLRADVDRLSVNFPPKRGHLRSGAKSARRARLGRPSPGGARACFGGAR
jgi:hypothetical protein